MIEKKFFKNSFNIVLRFGDGTRTKEYFHCYDLTKTYLIANHEETSSKDLDFVDIIIVAANSAFRRKIEKLQVCLFCKVDLYSENQAFKYFYRFLRLALQLDCTMSE